MARTPAAFAFALLLLAGCSSDPVSEGASEGGSVSSSAFTVTGDNRIAAPVVTDTSHFLAPPELTPKGPTASEPVRVPIQSLFEQEVAAGQNAVTWNVLLPHDLNGLAGQAKMWTEIKGGSLVGNPFVTSGGCFWALSVNAGASQTGEYRDLGCATAGLQVQPGVYELDFAFSHPEVVWQAGTELRFSFITNEQLERPPGVTVELLTASVSYDSHIQVYGLELPLDGGLLRQTTA